MKTIMLVSSLETANNGDMTHYGGSFTVTDGVDSVHEYYRGSDRSNTAVACIEEVLSEHFDVAVPEEQWMLIDSFIYEKSNDSLALRVDEAGVVTGAEPVSTTDWPEGSVNGQPF